MLKIWRLKSNSLFLFSNVNKRSPFTVFCFYDCSRPSWASIPRRHTRRSESTADGTPGGFLMLRVPPCSSVPWTKQRSWYIISTTRLCSCTRRGTSTRLSRNRQECRLRKCYSYIGLRAYVWIYYIMPSAM